MRGIYNITNEEEKEISDEEMREIDECVEFLGKLIAEDEKKPSVVVKEKVKEYEFAYKAMPKAIEGEGLQISHDENGVVPGTAYVTVRGETISITDTALFSKFLSSAMNFEVYPRTDKRVELGLGFNGLTRKVVQ